MHFAMVSLRQAENVTSIVSILFDGLAEFPRIINNTFGGNGELSGEHAGTGTRPGAERPTWWHLECMRWCTMRHIRNDFAKSLTAHFMLHQMNEIEWLIIPYIHFTLNGPGPITHKWTSDIRTLAAVYTARHIAHINSFYWPFPFRWGALRMRFSSAYAARLAYKWIIYTQNMSVASSRRPNPRTNGRPFNA